MFSKMLLLWDTFIFWSCFACLPYLKGVSSRVVNTMESRCHKIQGALVTECATITSNTCGPVLGKGFD